MKLKILEMEKDFMRFSIEGISEIIANTLRRTLINDIPKLAIHDVEYHHGQIRDEEGNVYDSSTPLFDEVIAQRLGMIPLPTDLEIMMFKEDCSCKGTGCPLCSVVYSLHKLGPTVVYSGDLVCVNDSKSKAVDSLIPIVKLKENQAILIYATAVLGTAKEHVKWQSTSGVSYKYHREITIDKSDEVCKNIKKESKKNIIKETPKEMIVTDDIPSEVISNYLARFDIEPNISEDKTKFVFQYESDGSLTAKEILQYALKRIQERFKDLKIVESKK